MDARCPRVSARRSRGIVDRRASATWRRRAQAARPAGHEDAHYKQPDRDDGRPDYCQDEGGHRRFSGERLDQARGDRSHAGEHGDQPSQRGYAPLSATASPSRRNGTPANDRLKSPARAKLIVSLALTALNATALSDSGAAAH